MSAAPTTSALDRLLDAVETRGSLREAHRIATIERDAAREAHKRQREAEAGEPASELLERLFDDSCRKAEWESRARTRLVAATHDACDADRAFRKALGRAEVLP